MINSKTFNMFILGDEESTGKVYREYRNLAYYVIATYVGNAEDCNDILSDTFLKVLQNRKNITGVSSLKQFICTTAKNLAIDFLRKDNRLEKSDLIDEMYGEEDRTNNVLNLLEPYLSNKELIVVYYKAVFEYSWDEIAKETGIPSSTARLIYKTAKEKLKKELKNV